MYSKSLLIDCGYPIWQPTFVATDAYDYFADQKALIIVRDAVNSKDGRAKFNGTECHCAAGF